MISKGDILICKKGLIYHEKINSLVGERYVVDNIESSGNMNVYVSCERMNSFCFSLVKIPDIRIAYSSYYLYDYFDELIEVRDTKLRELGI